MLMGCRLASVDQVIDVSLRDPLGDDFRSFAHRLCDRIIDAPGILLPQKAYRNVVTAGSPRVTLVEKCSLIDSRNYVGLNPSSVSSIANQIAIETVALKISDSMSR